MCSSAFKKASVILDDCARHYYHFFKHFAADQTDVNHGVKTRSHIRVASYSHSLYDISHFVLVGSSVETIPCVEHVIQIANLLLKD